MFSTIAGSGRIQSGNGEPAANFSANVELFFIQNNSWSAIAEFQTNQRGDFKFTARVNGFEEAPAAPLLRIVDVDRRSVVPAVPNISIRRQVLSAAFGTIRLAGEGVDSREVEELKRELQAANRKISELEAEIEGNEGRGDNLDSVSSAEIKRLKLELIGKETELKEAVTKLALAETRATEAEEERSTLQVELDQIRNADTSSPLITDLAGSVAKSLGDASKSDSASGFKLADAQVTLKGYLADGGSRFKPLDAAEIVRANAAGASEISFRLAPSSEAASDGPKMPDLVGLTPASARRILRPLGQAMQVVEAKGKPVGGIIRQVPRAGATLDPDATIRLVVAVEDGEET